MPFVTGKQTLPEEVKPTALIVEENPDIRKLLTDEAARCGYAVTACASAGDGWRHYEQAAPRLIILGGMLPDMDSISLCKKIRRTATGKYCTVLMTTDRQEPREMETAIRAGVDYFMAEPVQKEILRAWLTVTREKLLAQLRHEENTSRIEEYKQELESMNDQLEGAITRANQMAMSAEQAYIELNQIFRTVPGGIVLIDRDCNLLRHNESFLKMAGLNEYDPIPGKCYDAFDSELCNSPQCTLARIMEGENRIESEIRKDFDDGSYAYYHIISTPFRGPGGELMGIVEHIMDITQRVKDQEALKKSERRYRELSIVDELSGLFNKRHFNHILQLETERAERYANHLSLLMMDIDNFKLHNDTYGHGEGDKVLARLGEIVSASVRTNDVACRYGGEEFAVILPQTAGDDAVVVAERIRRAFAAEIFQPRPQEKTGKTLSIGIAQFAAGEKRTGLLKRADENLYAAKQQGKNRSVLR